MKRRHIDLLAPPFSGHLNPILAIGRVLRDDYEVRVVSTHDAQDRIKRAGLTALPLLEGHDKKLQNIANPTYAVRSNPILLHRQFSEVITLFRQLRSELQDLYRSERPDLLIADFTLGTVGPVAMELGIPWWTSVPSPCVIESTNAPPAYLGGLMPLDGLTGVLRDCAGRLGVKMFKRLIGWLYRASIRDAGLRSIYRPDGSEAIYSNQRILVLGLQELEFSRVWPKAATVIGPMLYTPPAPVKDPPFALGRRHVLVTMGTHLEWIKDEVARMAQAVAKKMPDVEFHFSDGRITGNDAFRQNNFIRLPFVDYERNIHRYDTVIHHGGSGVMYYCLMEGRPSVVYPVDYDQFDNAARLEKAGVARRMRKLEQMETMLRETLENSEMSRKCTSFSHLLKLRPSECMLKEIVDRHFDVGE